MTPNEWKHIKRNGDRFIKSWIEENLRYKSCLVVLIGSETYNRKWVDMKLKRFGVTVRRF
ncbi:TIR domain-containing protein [Chryseobacterium rhizosphaerae]|uniref:TIR domain-containing protein n=1 Tax=Chryseobacterium rhizosphaerae TaxID=395937 RepID=UPI0035B507C0